MNLSATAAATLTSPIIGYLIKFFPIEQKPEDFPPLEVLEKRWGKLYKIMSFTAMPMMVVGVYLVWLLLAFLIKATAIDTHGAVLVYLPNHFIQLLPAVFLGIFFTAAVMLSLERLFMNKESLSEYIYYQDLKLNGNSRKLFSRMAMVMVPLSLILSLLLADQYALFKEEMIVINTFTRVGGRIYSYDQLTSIETKIVVYKEEISGEETGRSQDIQLTFSDGDTWGTDAGGGAFGSSEKINKKLIALLQSKTTLNFKKLSPEIFWED